MRLTWSLFSLLLATALLVGCLSPHPSLISSQRGEGEALGFFDAASTRASVSIRLIDKRQTTQALSDADAYNGVLFELSNASRLKSAQRVAKAKSLGSYDLVFDQLPSDSNARYIVTAGFFRGVGVPTSLSDPAYATLDAKVAEGSSEGFTLSPGQQKTLTLVINALGALSFTSTSTTIDPAAPSFAPGDATAAGLIALSPARNPLATGVTYTLKRTNGTTVSTGSVPVAQWATWPTETRLPFTAPTTEGTYAFVVDMVNGATVLSRRSRDVVVKLPMNTFNVTGTAGSLKLNGQAWKYSTNTSITASRTADSDLIMFINNSSVRIYFFFESADLNESGDGNLNPSESASFSVPASAEPYYVNMMHLK